MPIDADSPEKHCAISNALITKSAPGIHRKLQKLEMNRSQVVDTGAAHSVLTQPQGPITKEKITIQEATYTWTIK